MHKTTEAEDTAVFGGEEHANSAHTALTLYFQEMGQTALLRPIQEIELARRIRKGDREAREHMIKANLRLVVKIARDFDYLGLPLLDLINEGNIGLMKAVERFDPAKGAKLSTYGAWWIKQSIKRALADQSKTIRLPVHVEDKLFHMRRVASRLEEAFGREPTDDELAEELGWTPFRVAHLRTAAIHPASLNAPMGDGETNQFSEIIEDKRAEIPSNVLDSKLHSKLMKEAFAAVLDSREKAVLRARFLEDDEQTLEEVGEKFGVTRERIRQVQNIALGKVRRYFEKKGQRSAFGITLLPKKPKRGKRTRDELAELWKQRNAEYAP